MLQHLSRFNVMRAYHQRLETSRSRVKFTGFHRAQTLQLSARFLHPWQLDYVSSIQRRQQKARTLVSKSERCSPRRSLPAAWAGKAVAPPPEKPAVGDDGASRPASSP